LDYMAAALVPAGAAAGRGAKPRLRGARPI
jgi:hypothetical protein